MSIKSTIKLIKKLYYNINYFNIILYYMPYNLTLDVPSNRDVVERLREMDEWIDLHPQYVATNIQPDHFGNRMLVGGGMDDGRYLMSGSNNRNTPYHFRETMATASAGKIRLGKAIKSVGKTLAPVGKFTYKEIIKPVAKELKEEGVSLAKEMLKEAIKSALTSTPEGQGLPTGRKPRGAGRKCKGGNVYPSATMVHGEQKYMGRQGNIASVGGTMEMDLPTDTPLQRGGKFNLGKALKKTGKDIGHFVTHDYTDAMIKVAPVAKKIGVIAGREAIPLVFEAVGAEFGVPPQVSGAIGKSVAKHALSEKNTGVKGGKRGRPKKAEADKKPKAVKGQKGGREARAEIVKKVMKEKGLKMIQASKYVKEHGLY
jgi:hypothetical protein